MLGICGTDTQQADQARIAAGVTLVIGLVGLVAYQHFYAAGGKGTKLAGKNIQPLPLQPPPKLPPGCNPSLEEILAQVREGLRRREFSTLCNIETPDGPVRLGILLDYRGEVAIGPTGQGSKMICLCDSSNSAVRQLLESHVEEIWSKSLLSPNTFITLKPETDVSSLMDHLWPKELELKPGELFPSQLAERCTPDPRKILAQIEKQLAAKKPMQKLYEVNTPDGPVRLGVLYRHEGSLRAGPFQSGPGLGLLHDGSSEKVRNAFKRALELLGEKYDASLRLDIGSGAYGSNGSIGQIKWS